LVAHHLDKNGDLDQYLQLSKHVIKHFYILLDSDEDERAPRRNYDEQVNEIIYHLETWLENEELNMNKSKKD